METPEQPAEKNKGGRPLKFKTVDELQAAIDSYFDQCDPHLESRLVESGINERGETIFAQRKVMTEQKPYTVSGLARALGIHRETLVNYKDSDKFSDSLAIAYDRCHEWAETAAGAIDLMPALDAKLREIGISGESLLADQKQVGDRELGGPRPEASASIPLSGEVASAIADSDGTAASFVCSVVKASAEAISRLTGSRQDFEHILPNWT